MSNAGRTGLESVRSHWPEVTLAVALLIALGFSGAVGATGPGALLLVAALPVLFIGYLDEVDRWSDQGAVPLLASLLISGLLGAIWGLVVNSNMIGDALAAGAVVTRDVADFALVTGVPAEQTGWMSAFGERVDLPLTGNGEAVCAATGDRYVLRGGKLERQAGA